MIPLPVTFAGISMVGNFIFEGINTIFRFRKPNCKGKEMQVFHQRDKFVNDEVINIRKDQIRIANTAFDDTGKVCDALTKTKRALDTLSSEKDLGLMFLLNSHHLCVSIFMFIQQH